MWRYVPTLGLKLPPQVMSTSVSGPVVRQMRSCGSSFLAYVARSTTRYQRDVPSSSCTSISASASSAPSSKNGPMRPFQVTFAASTVEPGRPASRRAAASFSDGAGAVVIGGASFGAAVRAVGVTVLEVSASLRSLLAVGLSATAKELSSGGLAGECPLTNQAIANVTATVAATVPIAVSNQPTTLCEIGHRCATAG